MGAQARDRLSHDVEASGREHDGDVRGRVMLVELEARERDGLNLVSEGSEDGRQLSALCGASEEARSDDDDSQEREPGVYVCVRGHPRPPFGKRGVNAAPLATSAGAWY
jgi:hypothetical protein